MTAPQTPPARATGGSTPVEFSGEASSESVAKPTPATRAALHKLADAGGSLPVKKVHGSSLKALLERRYVYVRGDQAVLTETGWTASRSVRRRG